jgi:DNA-3-methyladenine glycosylase
MAKLLDESFYLDSQVVDLSEALLGKFLCTNIEGCYTSGMIVETEAYRAPEDKASHAYGNRRTKRTETMYDSGGHAYIYLCYGIHHLFNVVTGPQGYAHAILIRAIEPVEGIGHMLQRRKMAAINPRLSNGPGILTKALGLDIKWNGESLLKRKHIWIEDRHSTIGSQAIIRSPRVGVDYAGECSSWNWRFRIKQNSWCSPAK